MSLKVPKGYHPLSYVARYPMKGVPGALSTIIIEPTMIASDSLPGENYCTYLTAGKQIWGVKKFKSLSAANRYAVKIASKYKLKVSLLE